MKALLGALSVAALAALEPAVAGMERALDEKAEDDMSPEITEASHRRRADADTLEGGGQLPDDVGGDGARGRQQEDQSDAEDGNAEGTSNRVSTNLVPYHI